MTNRPVITPKEYGALIGRSARWVSAQCRAGRIPTLAPHRRPYLIPKNALFCGSELLKAS